MKTRFAIRSLQAVLMSCGALAALCPSAGADDSRAPEPILLWPDGAPGALGSEDADHPTIRYYPAPRTNRTGAAIVVCPGGGYGILASDHEGQQVARWLNSIGVSAAVLKYRLGPMYRHPAPLHDAQRAIRFVRSHAAEWKIAPNRIGVMGFSAGGHLASTASTHFDDGSPDAVDPIERESCRPDFSVLCYPVISFTAPFAHRGSVRNLLGENPDPQLLHALSNETQVNADTPPTFLFHTAEDTGVSAQNSLAYYQALLEHKIPAELHVYQNGPHGVGLAAGDPVLSTWPGRLADWLRQGGFLAESRRAAVTGTISVDGQPIGIGAIVFVPEHELHPSTFSLVFGGRYTLPEAVGPTVGKQHVLIYNLGGVGPAPTIGDAVQVSTADQVFNIQSGENSYDLELTTEAAE